MVKVVADTNIYISALFWRGNPYKFIHLCFEGKDKLVISKQIIDELERILLTEGEVDYLVSGNKHLLDIKEFQGIKIVTARQILEILGV